MSASLIWLIISVVFFIFEAVTVGLVCIWFGIGALLSFLVSLLTENIIIQLIVFVLGTAISFIVLKPFFKKAVPEKDTRTNTSSLVGKIAVVKEDITLNTGRVLVGDVLWMARSSENIAEGENVRIKETKSNTLIVERL